METVDASPSDESQLDPIDDDVFFMGPYSRHGV